jgi:magnesium transporter
MLTIYESNGKGLTVHDPAAPITDNCVWLDLLQPTQEEDRLVEELIGVEIPTRAEMREIEPSNRFYQEKGAYFMTASIVYNVEAPVPSTTPVTFILPAAASSPCAMPTPRRFHRSVMTAGVVVCPNVS